MTSEKKRLVRAAVIIGAAVSAAVLYLSVSMAVIEPQAHIAPGPKIDIRRLLTRQNFTEKDYETLYCQTGLGRAAIDEMRKLYPDFTERLLRLQKNFFNEISFICEKNSPISREESIVDKDGKYISGTEFAPLHNGDILITKSSHTYGWRNGHSALVIDAIRGRTLESVVLGTNSSVQDISKWLNYPNFMLLRLKDAPPELADKIADMAEDLLNDIPYNLTVGIFSPKFDQKDKISGTHCSHLIWQAYRFYGFDLDSDGGVLVTPKDIAKSPVLEVVQVYGVDPGNIWP